MLIESLSDTSNEDRWLLADLMLEALIETYNEELRTTADEKISDSKRRAKLSRWKNATHGLVQQLERARLGLLPDRLIVINVDAQHQVILILNNEPIAFTAPRGHTETLMEERVVRRFCELRDCSILDNLVSTSDSAHHDPKGLWLIGDRTPPAFEIASQIRCEFFDLTQRASKEHACKKLAEEIERLEKSPNLARQIHLLTDQTSSVSQHYLKDNFPHISRIGPRDRQAIANWLQEAAGASHQLLIVRYGDLLLGN